MKQHKPTAILFDLDGTLLNTAPDIAQAMNIVLHRHNRPSRIDDTVDYHIYGGSITLLAYGFDMTPEDPLFDDIQQELFDEYLNNIADKTHYYPEIETILNTLNEQQITWGIITNKPEFLTRELLKHFPLLNDTPFWLGGDSLPQSKPSPVPLLHACEILQLTPEECYYVGDSETDCIAAQQANMTSITMLYGHQGKDEDARQWQSDYYFQSGEELLSWLKTQLSKATEEAY